MPEGMSSKIGNVFGVEIPRNLQIQLKQRKLAIAKGDVKKNMVNEGEIRDNETLKYLANKSSWVRLVSSVNVASKDDMRYFQKYFPNLNIDKPDSLAKNFVLFAGTSKYNTAQVADINSPTGFKSTANYQLRSGIDADGAYNILGDAEWESYGARPMPGITDVKIETMGKLGSVRSATISFNAWDKYQLDVIDALYFKMGYTMFLEWGHAVYYDKKGELQTSTYSIVDPFAEDLTKEELARQIAQGVEDTNGNYDGMLAMCTNFTFDLNKEGGFDCTIKLIALGGLADSIKINQSKNLSEDIKAELGLLVQKINADAKQKAKEEWLRQNQYAIQQNNDKIAAATKDKEDALKKAREASNAVNKAAGRPIRETIILGYKDIANWKGLYDSAEKINEHGAIKGSQGTAGAFVSVEKTENKTTGITLYKGLYYLNRGFLIAQTVGRGDADPKNEENYDKIILNNKLLKDIFANAKDGIRLKDEGTNFITNFEWSVVGQSGDSINLRGYYTSNGKKFGYVINISGDLKKSILSYTSAYSEGGNDTTYSVVNGKGRIFGDNTKGELTAIIEKLIAFLTSFGDEYEAPSNALSLDISNDGGDTWFAIGNSNISKNGNNNGTQYKDSTSKQYVDSRSAKISYSWLIKIPVSGTKTYTGPSGNTITENNVQVDASTTVKLTTFDPDVIKSVKLKPGTADALASAEFETIQKQQIADEAVAAAGAIEVPKPIEVPELTVDEVTADEATKYHSNLEYFLRAIQIHSINKTISVQGNRTKLVDLEEGDFIYKLLSKGFIPVEVLKEFSNSKGSKLPDKWKITNLDNISGYSQRQKIIYSFASYGFNHNLMSRPNYSKDQVDDIPQQDFYNMFTSVLPPFEPINSLVKDVKIGRPVYIRLSLLLFAINQMCLLYDSPDKKNGEMSPKEQFPIMYLDFNRLTNTCLTEPAQLSTDPYKFLIEFRCTNDEYLKLFAGAVSGIEDESTVPTVIDNILNKLGQEGLFKPEQQDTLSADLPAFKDSTNPSGEASYVGYFLNTLVNIDYILDLCKKFGKEDESESVYLKPFLQQLISDMGKSLGDINFFRLAYNDQSNCMYITDDQVRPLQAGESYIPLTDTTAFETTSELPVFGKYSIAKSLSIKTEVNSKLSNMLAISANSKSKSTAGKDATPFGVYNANFIDRYKKQALEIADENGIKTSNEISNALFFNAFVKSIFSSTNPSVDDVSQATNYYIDRMNKRKSINPATKSSAMIPVSVNLTFEGISGFYMGHAFTLPEQLLPYAYTREAVLSNGAIPAGKRVGFVVVGVDHSLQDSQWLTNLRANMIYLKDSQDFRNVAGLNRNALTQGPANTFVGTSGDTSSVTGANRCENFDETSTNGAGRPIVPPSWRGKDLCRRYKKTEIAENDRKTLAQKLTTLIGLNAAKAAMASIQNEQGFRGFNWNLGGVDLTDGRWAYDPTYMDGYVLLTEGGTNTFKSFVTFKDLDSFVSFQKEKYVKRGFSNVTNASEFSNLYYSKWLGGDKAVETLFNQQIKQYGSIANAPYLNGSNGARKVTDWQDLRLRYKTSFEIMYKSILKYF
jgi:hypothetical protein